MTIKKRKWVTRNKEGTAYPDSIYLWDYNNKPVYNENLDKWVGNSYNTLQMTISYFEALFGFKLKCGCCQLCYISIILEKIPKDSTKINRFQLLDIE